MTVFILANTFFPAIAAFLLELAPLSMNAQFWTAVGLAAALFAANIYFFKTSPNRRRIIGAVTILNLAALLFFGDISFFTAIPHLLNYLPGGPYF